MVCTGHVAHLGSIIVRTLCLTAGYPDLVGRDGSYLLSKRPPCLLPKLEQQLVLMLEPWQQQQLFGFESALWSKLMQKTGVESADMLPTPVT